MVVIIFIIVVIIIVIGAEINRGTIHRIPIVINHVPVDHGIQLYHFKIYISNMSINIDVLVLIG